MSLGRSKATVLPRGALHTVTVFVVVVKIDRVSILPGAIPLFERRTTSGGRCTMSSSSK